VDKKGINMAYNTYFGSKPVSDWVANGPAEGGHNFIDQINEQKGKISSKEGEYSAQQGELGSARNAYKDAYQNQQNYSDLYNQAKTSEGVDDAKAQYQKSLNVVNATNAAMNTLPSAINAGSNVVLNASQRNAALGKQMAQYQTSLDHWTNQNAQDNSAYQTALASAQDLAGRNMSQEQARVAQAMTDYQSQMDYANKLYNDLIQERQTMRTIYGQMYDDEYRHMQQELEAWIQNLQEEGNRYAQEQETARNNARLAAEKYASDAGLRLQQYLQQQEEAKQAKLNQPEDKSRISSNGYFYSPQTGDPTYLDPIVTYRDNGKNGYNRVENYVATPEMLAQLMYGGN
jgi:hypothetical protein